MSARLDANESSLGVISIEWLVTNAPILRIGPFVGPVHLFTLFHRLTVRR